MLASPRKREGSMRMRDFDRQDWGIVLFGWMVALWVTLS
jgi:hypothetical protein